MDALQKVFDTIMQVLNIIKDFFNQLLPNNKEDEATDAPAEEA